MKFYEISPNIEIVSNQSNTFYFSPMISMSNLLDIEYHNNSNKIAIKEIHKMMDYTCISDEECMNLRFLFSEPTNNNTNNNMIQFIRSEGFFPSGHIQDNKVINDITSNDDESVIEVIQDNNFHA